MRSLLTGTLKLLVISVLAYWLAACKGKNNSTSSLHAKDSITLDSLLISIYEQTHNNRPLRIARLDSLAAQCGEKKQINLQMRAYSQICNEYQFEKNTAALDSFSQKARAVASVALDSSVHAAYHFISGKNLYATSRRPDSAMSHLLKAVAFSKGSDKNLYIKSVLILGLIAQESGDYTTALGFLDQAIEGKKNDGNDSLLLAHYYMLAALLASSKVDTAATYDYYNLAKAIINKARLDKVSYQSFVEARLAFFEKRYTDALAAYNEPAIEFNLLVYTDKIRLFAQTGQQDSIYRTLAMLDSHKEKIYADKDVLKEYLPLKIKYSSAEERNRYADEYTALMKKMLIENKAVVIQKNLHEIERVQVEKENLQNMARQERRTTIAVFSAILLAMAGLIAFLVIASKRRKLQYALLRSQYDTSKQERNRIAQELHDDLGANFTSINMAANLLESKQKGTRPKELDIILNNTQKVYTQLREIVWSMNAENDNLGNLILYIKRFANTFLEQAQIQIVLKDDTAPYHDLFIDALTRRRVFLACKEIINNTVKHAQASHMELSFKMQQQQQLHIMLYDNGTGFNATRIHSGNGLQNIQRTINDIAGSKVQLESGATGTRYSFTFIIKKHD